MKDQPWDDCDNPEMMRELIGLDDPLPYVEEYAGPTYVEGKA